MSPRPKHMTPQGDLQTAIKEIAWKQIAEYGAASLSLRAIARELGVTAPAIYNYYPSRDELVTTLILDAYISFGDSQLTARDALPPEDRVGRLQAIGLAYRQWALTYPQRYQLIFGTPIPGYVAPMERVFPAAARSLSALVSVIESLRQAGQLRSQGFPSIQPQYKVDLETWQAFGGKAELISLSIAVLIWARVHGLVSLEIAGNLPPFGATGDDLYRYEIQSIEKQFIQEKS